MALRPSDLAVQLVPPPDPALLSFVLPASTTVVLATPVLCHNSAGPAMLRNEKACAPRWSD